jgi:hypothetical protein
LQLGDPLAILWHLFAMGRKAFRMTKMTISTSVTSILGVVFDVLAKSQTTITQINQTCSNKGLPPAFSISPDGIPEIPGNPDYRFDGFGVIVGIPPQLSFYVEYKPGSPQQISLGRFTVPVGVGTMLHLNRLLG